MNTSGYDNGPIQITFFKVMKLNNITITNRVLLIVIPLPSNL